jgi:argininosuccinate synthase
MEKVVLAYSGGLDTSVAIKWLQEKGYEVIALAVDVGQPGDLQKVKEKALKTGAIDSLVVDAKEEFAKDFVIPALKANAMYENKYPLATALARPLIGKYLVETALDAGAGYVAHGCTAKGNDQVRFELAIKSLGPDLKVIAPARVWGMTREDSIEYAKKHGIEVEAKKESPYSVDENIWGRSAECGLLEDPWVEPPEDAFDWTNNPADSPDDHLYVNVAFEKGVPISVDGEKLGLTGVISKLNEIGGKYGVGRIDMVEDRVVGIKSREIYEAPAGTILIMAHRELESIVLEKEVLQYKQKLEADYAKLVYNGQWFSPLKEAFDAFIDKTQAEVTGQLRLKFYKGNVTIVGRHSENSLYNLGMATYEKGDVFKHDAAEGFIELFGLPLTQWAKRREKK